MLAIAFQLAIAAANPNPFSLGSGECVEVKLTGAANYDVANDAFVGDGTLIAKGADAVAVRWASILFGEKDGQYVSSHDITLGHDTFSTFDSIVLTPTASPTAFDFVNHLKIATGTGRVNAGEILVFGTVDFAAGTVVLHGSRGKVCNAH